MNKNFSPDLYIKQYLIDLILPKCDLVFTKYFSSIYFQILLHTNHSKNDDKWKLNKCWMSNETIAKSINCNVRTVNKVIKNMESLDLLKISYHGTLKMYELQNFKLFTKQQIRHFNSIFDKKIKEEIIFDKKKLKKIKLLFKNINKDYFSGERYDYYFQNINKLRNLLFFSEQIYAGSSLMFIMFFARNYINASNIKANDIKQIPQEYMALKLGCSQATISRYLKTFEENKFLLKDKKIIINKELIDLSTDVSKQNLICPICGQKILDEKKFLSHISRKRDKLHQLMKKLRIENDAKTFDEIKQLYDDHFDEFDALIDKEELAKKELHSHCNKLIKYFYSLTQSYCPNWAMEQNILKSHIKNGLTDESIKDVMNYMAKKGYRDLKYFNSSINDALTIKKCKEEFKIKDSDSNLIGYFYKKQGLRLTDRLMLQGIKKIQELKLNDYSVGQIKIIIDYMINKKCPNFNFIVTMANDALSGNNNLDELTKAYDIKSLINEMFNSGIQYGNIILEDCNCEIMSKDKILKLKNDICDGKVQLTKINKKYYKLAIMMSKEIYSRQLYNVSLTEWLDNTKFNDLKGMM